MRLGFTFYFFSCSEFLCCCFTIPRLSNEPRRGPFSREIYRQRNIVERAIDRLKQFRRIATRYEKLTANYTATIAITCILLWL
ncbi:MULTISPECIES: transposase [unclassified Microcoleus]|uniref:transposase n=1 Tax=unclassified Microcoleus TaxID=2642155 RepID=UPI004040BE3D